MDARFRREEFKYCDVANFGNDAAFPPRNGGFSENHKRYVLT